MAITFNNTANKAQFAGNHPVFQVEPVQYEVMGYMLENAPDAGVVVPQGTPLSADMKTKKANICKYAVVVKKKDAKNFYVSDLGFLAAGDKVFISGAETKSLSTIASVDKKEKLITLSANNTDIKVGDVLVEGKSVTTGEGQEAVTTIEPVAIPNRIVSRAEVMRENNKSVNAAYRGVPLLNVLNYPSEWLDETSFPGSILLKGNPHFLFVTQ